MKLCPKCLRETAGLKKCGHCQKRLLRPDWVGRPIRKRFMDRVEKAPSGCWMWKGGRNYRGYGLFCFNGRSRLAHRVSWELFVGKPMLQICHHCDTPGCVNPEHLYDADQSANLHDMVARGRRRYASGEQNHNHKLTETDVRSLRERRLAGETWASIARSLGCGETTVRHAFHGVNWRHV